MYVSGLGGGQQLEWVARSGASIPTDPDWVGDIFEVALSPDGSRIAFADGNRGTPADIWIKHLHRGPLVRITTSGKRSGTDNTGPTWTPDGGSVLFGSDYDVYRKRADGVGEAELILDLPEHTLRDAWFVGDGSELLYTRNYVRCDPGLPCDAGIYLRSLEGDSVIMSIDNPGVHDLSPALSPDGNWVAYMSGESGRFEIYVRPFPNVDDGRWLVSEDGGTQPVWAHSGRELFYINRNRELVAVEVTLGTQFEIGPSQVLFSAFDYRADWRDPQYAVAPGDDRFLMIRRVAGSDQSQLIVVRNWLAGVVEPLWRN